MIIFRYITREIFASMFGVCIVLVFIILSSRFGRYLAEAATGRIPSDILFSVIGLRIPVVLELVVPLSFFIAILLALGRMYVDSEMTALFACGFSRKRLLAYAFGPATVVAGLVAVLSLWLSPLGLDHSNALLEQAKARSEFETLTPAQFQSLGDSSAVIYTESLSRDRKSMFDVFVATSSDSETSSSLTLVKAEQGEQIVVEEYGRKYLQINRGSRLDGEPGSDSYRIVEFESYAQQLDEPEIRQKSATDRKPTLELIGDPDPQSQAALQWRLTLPALVFVLTVIAVPLAYTNPRQGRYTKMIPAILLYLLYLVALNAGRGAIEDEKLPALGLWIINAIFLGIGLLLFNGFSLRGLFSSKKVKKVKHA